MQAVNAAIQSADTTAGASNGAFAAANVTASIHTDSAGKEQLSFNSSNTAFQVTADDLMSNALIGNFNGSPQGNIAGSTGSSLIAGGAYMLATKASPNTENDLGFVPITAASGETQALSLIHI